MSLDLSPEAETFVAEAAAREGVAADTLIRRLFAPRPENAVQNLLALWQAEYGLPTPPGGSKTLTELSAEWQAEDADLTPEEREAERSFWEQRERTFDSRPPVRI